MQNTELRGKERLPSQGLQTPVASASLQPAWELLSCPQSLPLWLPVASGGRNKNVKTAILGKTAVPLAVPSLQQ